MSKNWINTSFTYISYFLIYRNKIDKLILSLKSIFIGLQDSWFMLQISQSILNISKASACDIGVCSSQSNNAKPIVIHQFLNIFYGDTWLMDIYFKNWRMLNGIACIIKSCLNR